MRSSRRKRFQRDKYASVHSSNIRQRSVGRWNSLHRRTYEGVDRPLWVQRVPRPEVEAVLNAHSGVVQSAVIGRSVEGNEEVVAFAQPLPGSPVTVTELAEHAARHLAPYKRQSQILIVSAIPVSPTGKGFQGRACEDGRIQQYPVAVTTQPEAIY
jgi:hypothetical protein